MSVCSGCVLFSRRGQAGVVACGEVWEADGEWMWSGESKGGVLVWLAGVGVGVGAVAAAAAAAAALVPCSHTLALLLPPSSLLLAETGLDQASNLAHARMRRSEALQKLFVWCDERMYWHDFLSASLHVLRLQYIHTSHYIYLLRAACCLLSPTEQ